MWITITCDCEGNKASKIEEYLGIKNFRINNIKILFCDRIEISEGIDVNKTGASKEYTTCHCHGVLDKTLKFQPVA